jgi:hypothetical protein
MKSFRTGLAGLLALVLLPMSAIAQSLPSPSYKNVTVNGQTISPDTTFTWLAPGVQIYDKSRLSFGGYSIWNEFGNGFQPVVQGAVSAIAIPSGSTVFQANAQAGYILNNSPATSGVSIFGQFLSGADNAGGDAINGVCSNAPSQTGYSATSGYSVGNMACIEADINSVPLIGGGQSSSNMYGLYAHGGSTIQPVGIFDAVYVNRAGSVGWKNGFTTVPGAADTGINLGPLALSGPSNSQSIKLNAYPTGTDTVSGFVTVTSAGNFVLASGVVNGSTLFTDSAGTFAGQISPLFLVTPGHLLSTGAAPALSGCGTSPNIAGTDLAGTILTGTGATACVLTFQRAYGTAPHCIVTTRNGASGFAYDPQTTAINFSGMTAGKIYDYVCASAS